MAGKKRGNNGNNSSSNGKCGNGKGLNKARSRNAGAGLFGGLTPEQLAVITGLLTKALSVESILIDKDKTIQIVLEGSLRKKTKADRLLEEFSDVSIGDVLDSIKHL